MPPKQLKDNVSRTKAPSPIGKSLFVGLRAADVFWQFNLLARGWGVRFIESAAGRAVPSARVVNPLGLGGLQPYYGVISLLSLGSSLKQIAHITLVSEQEMSCSSAMIIAAFNTIFNTTNTLLSLWAISSPGASLPDTTTVSDTLLSPLVAIGLSAYLIGLLAEAVSEFQRKAFKQNPDNKGKPYGGGLFSLATNINYGAYTLWRGAYALICGGPAWGAATFAFFFYDFASRGVPVMDNYLTERYGAAYTDIKKRVKYVLIPGIY
ncbi:hypothetical protein BBP40_003372 [Aspergillus hancockii]|nr:hypothetical protein BBP40_003372 [Aspergillus hancockii]